MHLHRKLSFYLDGKCLGLRVMEFMEMGDYNTPLFTGETAVGCRLTEARLQAGSRGKR